MRSKSIQLVLSQEGADVFVENFRTGAMKRFGVDYEAMAARNPALVYCSLSGFGQVRTICSCTFCAVVWVRLWLWLWLW